MEHLNVVRGDMLRGDPPLALGKIVRSESHVRYTCQIYGPGETATPPEPADFAFGSFVRLPVRMYPTAPDVAPLVPAAHGNGMRAPISDALIPRISGQIGHPGAPSASLERADLAPAAPAWAVGLIYDTLLVNPSF